MELIRVENVIKTYQLGEIDVPVLKGVSFSIQRGELVALMGASGSGKSTLMNILGCLDRPTSGKYWLDGKDIGALSTNERALVRTDKLGFVFQSFNLLSRTSAINNVLMPLDYSPSPPHMGEALERGLELLDRVGLSTRLDHIPSQMSGGQQQRVAIARSLVNQPALLLADEPTGNLDSKTSVEILEMFQQLNTLGLTIIIVTHDPKVAGYAHRTIRVADGLIVEDAAATSTKPTPNGDTRSHRAHVGIANGNSNGHTGDGHGNGHGGAANGDAHGGELLGDTDGGSGGVALKSPPRTQAAVPTAKAVAAPVEVEHARSARPGWVSRLLPATLRTAFNALRRNKMRSALTTLGVIIGVGAVIAMVEISDGSRSALLKTMSTMGANNLMVRAGAATSGGVSWGGGSAKTLTPKDADEIARQCPAVAAVAPVVQISGQVVRGNRNWIPMSIYGTTPEFLVIRDWQEMDDGEMFTDADVRAANKVCVIGHTLAKELFDGESPVGETIRVRNVSLRVLGVLGVKGANMMGMDQDDLIMAPWSTIKFRVSGNNTGAANANATAAATDTNNINKLYPGQNALYSVPSATQTTNSPQLIRFDNVDQIQVKVATSGEIPEAMEQITALLHERHRIRDTQDDDFNIRDMSEFLKMMSSTSKMMGGLLMIVAFISLAVGGVGIMNIMLVSVTERTREIGLRMAVGARSFHILRQFLIEAVVLCMFGGGVGILLGRTASILVWYFMRWPVQASLPAIAGAFAVSASIGIAFGFYPAWKASRLDPIEALRYE